MQLHGFRLLCAWLCLMLIGCVAPKRPLPVRTNPPIANPLPRLENPPILEIDAGGHTALINDVIFTRDGKHLVSASDDKTVRVWNVADGQIERVIRGQIGNGNEGKIFAAALSPDNRWLAVGGMMATFDGSNHIEVGKIRLIDFPTGQITRLLKGHANVIFALAFSPDSRRLISGSADDTARIWDVATGQTLHTLKGHTDDIYAVAFAPDGKRAVTGSDDHTLILWDVRTGQAITHLTRHTDVVRSAAFTPDGQYLLSGGEDKTIRLWDGKNGRFIRVLARQDTTVDSLSVAPDGKRVLTGSGYGAGKNCHVLSIPDGQNITTFTQHNNIVLATAISPDGRLAATGGGNDQAIYLWEIDSGKVRQKLVSKGKSVWSVGFSRDGRTLAWGQTWGSRSLFSHGKLEQSMRLSRPDQGFRLEMGEALTDDADYIRGIESVGDVAIRTPNGEVHPTLQILRNGKVAHKITRGSTDGYKHRSLTLTPDGKVAISGGGGGVLTSYDTATGRKLHEFIGHFGDVWGVAVSPDGKWLASGSHDQTVKLWDLASGENLITLFPASNNEWVAWTPEGFYASSENGGHYVGYHINRGADKAADYVRAEQIGKLFYRPDLVAKKVQGGFEKELRAELARIGDIDAVLATGLPPRITVVRKPPSDVRGFDHTLEIQIENQGGGIGRIEYIKNGVRIEIPKLRDGYAPGRVNVGERVNVTIPIALKTGPNQVEIRGWNKAGKIEDGSQAFSVNCKGRAKPALYVLAIGISTYYDSRLNLKMAHKDAQALIEEFRRRSAGLYDRFYPFDLINHEATTANIRSQFETIAKTIRPDDVFVLYLAGHGRILNGEYLFLPYEIECRNTEAIRQGGIQADALADWLTQIPAQKSLIILDTCYAGRLMNEMNVAMLAPRFRGGVEEITAIEKLMRATGRSIIAGSSEKQQAAEGKTHGIFTGVFLDGLRGAALRPGQSHGAVAISDLARYVGDEVPKITEKAWHFRQIPMYQIKGDFPIGCAQGFGKEGCHRE